MNWPVSLMCWSQKITLLTIDKYPNENEPEKKIQINKQINANIWISIIKERREQENEKSIYKVSRIENIVIPNTCI